MRRPGTYLLTAIFLFLGYSMVLSGERPEPFGFAVGRTSYDDSIVNLNSRKWTYEEYEKKLSRRIGRDSPIKGKNTYMLVNLKGMMGANGIRLCFSHKSMLDAVIINIAPNVFAVVMDELDRKYDLVKKNLLGGIIRTTLRQFCGRRKMYILNCSN